MHFLDLPLELVQSVFDTFILFYRFPFGLVHVMRRRLVSRRLIIYAGFLLKTVLKTK